MVLVVRLIAQQTNARLVVSAEKLQNLLMFHTHPLLQVLHRVDEPVSHQARDPLVGLQVGFTVRHPAIETGFEGFEFHFLAHVTCHLPRCVGTLRWLNSPSLDLSWNLLHGFVCGDFRPPVESFITRRAVAYFTLVPLVAEAGFTEVVTTWGCDRVAEDVLTNRTLEMIFLEWSKEAESWHNESCGEELKPRKGEKKKHKYLKSSLFKATNIAALTRPVTHVHMNQLASLVLHSHPEVISIQTMRKSSNRDKVFRKQLTWLFSVIASNLKAQTFPYTLQLLFHSEVIQTGAGSKQATAFLWAWASDIILLKRNLELSKETEKKKTFWETFIVMNQKHTLLSSSSPNTSSLYINLQSWKQKTKTTVQSLLCVKYDHLPPLFTNFSAK